MQVFLAEKPFIGCDGLEVTDEMRVTIAAQACLLILKRRTDYFAEPAADPRLPGAFIVDRVHTDNAGRAAGRGDRSCRESPGRRGR
jgi:Mlc titration factor MtfA (ptsG expression regulator)